MLGILKFDSLSKFLDSLADGTADLDELNEAAAQGDILTEEVGSMQFSIMPRSEQQKPEDRQKLAYILPAYFS